MSADLLSLQNLTLSAGDRVLCTDLAVRLTAGDRLAIVGASGSGKTLLLRALSALDSPPGSVLRWRGRQLTPGQIPAFRSRAVYLSQRPSLPEGSVRDALRAPFRYRANQQRCYSSDTANDLLDRLGLDRHFGDRPTENLSGGESQAVALVRALLLEPDILLLDEPTAAMDPQRVAAAETLIDSWMTDSGERALVWTSHHPEQLARVSNRQMSLVAMS